MHSRHNAANLQDTGDQLPEPWPAKDDTDVGVGENLDAVFGERFLPCIED